MRKKSKLVIIAIILSLLTFKEIAYCHEASREKSKNIIVNYAIDPPVNDESNPPTGK